MKKVTDFIVNHRYFVLTFFICLSIVSVFLFSHVHINQDMSEYLPSTSDTRKGMDIMEEEFDPIESSELSIMFKEMSQQEIEETKEYLSTLDRVTEVEYEKGKEYVLFTLTADVSADTEEASVIYQEIEDHFGNQIVDTSGEISAYNKTVLPFFIVLIAVGSALVILIIMSESYIEPFLFLAVILIAVVLNKGTNVIFPSISNITDSISALLQMALSMDYSIMLMNRYRQERISEPDKVEAMKKALHHAFQSISSSSVTTIVGLLALVFMSFTIGRDLGFVLAKGVVFSLLSIFTCLPGLILMFDKLIMKSKKKCPIFKLNFLGKLAYKCRYIACIVFLLIFVISYFLKGSLGILYTESGHDEIAGKFVLDNQMVIVYPKEKEEKLGSYCQKLEDEDKIESVLCYQNTINKPFSYQELYHQLTEMNMDLSIEEDLLRIIYYHYYGNDNISMSLEEFVHFIQEKVLSDPQWSKKLEDETRRNVPLLENFADPKKFEEKKDAKELQEIFSLNEETIGDLLTYYHAKENLQSLTLKDFLTFLNQDVLKNEKYASKMDQNAKNNLKTLLAFTDLKTINREMSSKEIATLLGMDEKQVSLLYTYFLTNQDIENTLTLQEFFNFITQVLVTDPNYRSALSKDMLLQLQRLSHFTEEEFIDDPMTYQKLAQDLELPATKVQSIYYYLFQDQFATSRLSPYQFIGAICQTPELFQTLEEVEQKQFQTLFFVMDSAKTKRSFTYQEISTYFSMEESLVKSIYAVYWSENFKLSPYQFISLLLTYQEEASLQPYLDQKTIYQLQILKNTMDSVQANKKYTVSQMAKFLTMDSETVSLLYSLYDIQVQKKSVEVSLKDFVSFLLKEVLPNPEYGKNLKNGMEEKLITLDTMMENSLKNTKYDENQLYELLLPLTFPLDKNLIDLLYLYYGSENAYDDTWKLSMETFVTYLKDTIMKQEQFSDFFDDSLKEKIEESSQLLQDTKEMFIGNHYARIILTTKLEPESKETFHFIEDLKTDLKNDGAYIIGDSPMAYEMSQSFNGELNLITVLTMLFIFLVVAVTFKSFLIPIILVLLIQCAVFLIMGILSFSNAVYFISILIVQSILMGATIDYAILYTSYYLEERRTNDKIHAIMNAYNNSIHTILTSASILIIVTLIVGVFASAVSAKICKTLSEGTLCSTILILLFLPAILATFDRWIIKKKKTVSKK